MKMTVIGAAGLTGLEVVKQALALGYEVTAFDLRKPDLTSQTNLHVVTGSVLDQGAVDNTVRSQDVVICELGVGIGNKKPIVSEGNRVVIEAMKKCGVRRLITQSAFGAGESWVRLPWYLKLAQKILLAPMSKDKERMEDIVRSSGLDWTIVQPIRLTSGPKTRKYQFGENIKIGFFPKISRTDVADCILNHLLTDEFVRKTIVTSY